MFQQRGPSAVRTLALYRVEERHAIALEVFGREIGVEDIRSANTHHRATSDDLLRHCMAK